MNEPLRRCWETSNPLHIKYHDKEWGVPLHDDQKFFEFLALGGFQAGLTWWLILERRDEFRKEFENFDPKKVAQYDSRKIETIMSNKKIIRNKAKILVTVNNANKFIEIQNDFGSFDAYIWNFVNNKTITNQYSNLKELPSESYESKIMSQNLKKKGFQFVGPTICYAFMQATGLVNDHLISCFRYDQLK